MGSMSTCSTLTTKFHTITFSSKPSQFHSLRLQKPLVFNATSKLRYSRGITPLIKASFDFPTRMIKPAGIIESDKLQSDVRKRTMDAIDACGQRVFVGDVVSRTGLNLNDAQKALQSLAVDTGGFLEVSDGGDVLYVFSRDYHLKLAAKSLRIKVEPQVERAKSAANYIMKVSFGTSLIASIVLVSIAIIAILVQAAESSGDSISHSGGSSNHNGGSNFVFHSSNSWSWWEQKKSDDYAMKEDLKAKDDGLGKRRKAGDDVKGFFDSVFSFVFGDGDPNQGIEEERWKLIGQYIVSNGAVVTAEELAPYLDVETTKKMNDESNILPVLLRFEGQPEVDEEGNILYWFRSLQCTAAPHNGVTKEYVGRTWADRVGGIEKVFREKKWQLSKTCGSMRARVIGLGVLNLFVVIILGILLKNMTVEPCGYVKFVSRLFLLLQIYACSFFVVPLMRWFFILKTNAEIEKRNHAREQHALALELPDLSLRRKLMSAWEMAQRTFIIQDKIVYSTEPGWDQRFQESQMSV